MKNIPYFFLLLLFIACNQPEAPVQEAGAEAEAGAPVFDSTLAAQYGADEYGMKTYVMAYLKSGPNRSQDSLEAARLQRAHLDNITRMAEAGQLVLAGPFLDGGDVRGIYIFNVATIEEAQALTETDPAIQAGRLVMELHPWYGSAALMELNDRHKKVAKKGI
ncbi:MAG: hypothetical protein KDC66_13245 [Phaeodactylibacter sp.]|nr:hypothetical protein [Phaeodactylibacter sp.]MCB9273427.1 hypothetical protein [Lewinellaceae bacterium]